MLQSMADEMLLIADAEEKQDRPVLTVVPPPPEPANEVNIEIRSIYRMGPNIGKEGIHRYIMMELRHNKGPVGLELPNGDLHVIRTLEDLTRAMADA